jgi:hypothetical protein
MNQDAVVLIRNSALAGALVSVAAVAGAVAGLGVTAFWIAIGVGAPLSVLVEYLASKRGNGPLYRFIEPD